MSEPITQVFQQEDGETLGLLEEFEEVFMDPQGLPPTRGHDHHIFFIKRHPTYHQLPYRCLYYQKVEIEEITVELLKSGGD